MAEHPVTLTKAQARRIAVAAQLLDGSPVGGVVDLVERLTLVQVEPTAAVAPTAEVVCWSRLGSSYRPRQMADALEIERRLFELRLMVRPMADVALYLAMPDDPPRWLGADGWVGKNQAFHSAILGQLAREGPLPASELVDTAVVPWRSSGWNRNRNVQMMLEAMSLLGEVAFSGRDGVERLWDLAERVYPEVDVPDAADAKRARDQRRLASLGIARARATAQPVEPIAVGQAGVAAVVDGVQGEWRVDPAVLRRVDDEWHGRTALLSPLDRLVFDRRRLAALFDYEFTLEQYKPAASRRWGYWAMPILHSDRLVGKLDATADRNAGVLFVDAVHQDVPFTTAIRRAVDAEIASLATWLGDLDVRHTARPTARR